MTIAAVEAQASRDHAKRLVADMGPVPAEVREYIAAIMRPAVKRAALRHKETEAA